MIDHYDWPGGREAMLRFGPDTGPIMVMALPLFEEHNRTRAFAVSILRALAARGVAGALPDLPGTGESLAPLDSLSLLAVATGYEAAVDKFIAEGRRVYGAAIRSGALLDKLGLLSGRWYLAPQDGDDLLRDLTRIKQAALGPGTVLGDSWHVDAGDPPVEIAGNMISTTFLTDLRLATAWQAKDGGPLRTVRLTTDPRPADRHMVGVPLWRRAEPGNDPALAALLAHDIADWVRACDG